MTVKLNGKGRNHAHALVDSGKVDKSSPWSLSADEENEMLGPNGDDWDNYSSWHLGVDDAENEKTKARFKYPFGKSGKCYRSALIAIRQRAGQQGATDIFDAAGSLLQKIDGDSKDDTKDSSKLSTPLYPCRFSAALQAAPWAIQREVLKVVNSAADPTLEPRARASGAPARAGAIAVLPLTGVLTQGGWADGGDMSTVAFGDALADAMDDDTVGAVLIAINSPGGSVYGCQELADQVFAARKAKPVIGIADCLAASAAYWIGSQCSEFYCAPSGEVGSIGVWTAHMDLSGLLANYGINVTLISAGKYKTEGNPFGPLDDDAKAAIQGSVDGYYSTFTSAVARGRSANVATVRDGMGQGRVLSAADAQKAGMIDGVATRADVIRGLARKLKGAQGSVAQCAAMESDPAPAPVAAPVAQRREQREREFAIVAG